jgi:hypothetical protein
MLDIVKAHGPSSRAWKSCTCPRLSVAAFRTMMELELGPLFISNPQISQTPPPRTFGGDSSCSRESLNGSLANFSRANCTSIVWSIHYCPPSASSYPRLDGCLSALPVTPLQQRFVCRRLEPTPTVLRAPRHVNT